MKIKNFCFLIVLLLYATEAYAQLGIKAGVNMANEIKTFSQVNSEAGFNSSNLTGYQFGLIYQAMAKKSGLGVEIGALLSQKGSCFHIDSIDVNNPQREGYKELNYLEVPLNLRYHLSIGFIGIYGFGGIYGGYALSGQTVNETANTTDIETYQSFVDHLDYGYNFGAGIELFKKVQLGGSLSQGLKTKINTDTNTSQIISSKNRVVSVNLVYLF